MPLPTDKPKRRLRLPRWSMAAMFIGITIVCVWFGLLSQSAKEQKRAVEALRARNGNMIFYDYELDEQLKYKSGTSPPGPAWLRDLMGVDYFSEVAAFTAVEAYDQHEIRRPGRQVLGYTGLRDEDLRELRNLRSLRALALDGSREITDATMQHIRSLDRLQLLSVGGAQISDSGLRNLVGFHELTHLSLHRTNITSQGLLHLAHLTALQHLDLSRTSVSDQHLEQLHGLTQLTFLDLTATQVTQDGLDTLQAVIPNCSIEWSKWP